MICPPVRRLDLDDFRLGGSSHLRLRNSKATKKNQRRRSKNSFHLPARFAEVNPPQIGFILFLINTGRTLILPVFARSTAFLPLSRLDGRSRNLHPACCPCPRNRCCNNRFLPSPCTCRKDERISCLQPFEPPVIDSRTAATDTLFQLLLNFRELLALSSN